MKKASDIDGEVLSEAILPEVNQCESPNMVLASQDISRVHSNELIQTNQ
jgi:hypothetical protein